MSQFLYIYLPNLNQDQIRNLKRLKTPTSGEEAGKIYHLKKQTYKKKPKQNQKITTKTHRLMVLAQNYTRMSNKELPVPLKLICKTKT